MEESLYQAEKNTEVIEKKLESILNDAEEQKTFNSQNFVSLKTLVFIWVIGSETSCRKAELLFKEEIKKIVSDIRTVQIISDWERTAGEEAFHAFAGRINQASQDYLDVRFDKILICPVFLMDCLCQREDEQRVADSWIMMQTEMRKRQISVEWHPFLMVESYNVDLTKYKVQMLRRQMDRIMENGRKNYLECCCPCCVLSDVNENGHKINLEQKIKTIIMLMIFQDTDCEDKEKTQGVLLPVRSNEKEYFFTARAISVCEPVKSLTLNRLLAVHEYYKSAGRRRTTAFDKMKYEYFESASWKKRMEKIPHGPDGKICTSPIYSVIPGNDMQKLEKRLKKFANDYYLHPIKATAEVVQEWWDSFVDEYLLELNGAVKHLGILEERSQKILENSPVIDVRQGMFYPDMRQSCEQWLAGEIRQAPRKIIAEGLAPEKENMKRFRQKKKVLDDVFQSMEQAVSNQEKRLGQTELLFNTGGGFVADAQEEARRWMEEYNNNHPHEVIHIFHKYQKIIAGFFKDHEKDQKNRTGNDLLEICNRIVAGSLENREEYMKVRLTNLVQGDSTQFFKKLEENWKFPVRLIGGFQASSHQTLFVMGNEENLLCRCLRNQPTYDISFKGCPQDDRIEIVRISGRFAENRIYSE